MHVETDRPPAALVVGAGDYIGAAIADRASIGEAYWMLHGQTRDAWTFELDLRPHRETW